MDMGSAPDGGLMDIDVRLDTADWERFEREIPGIAERWTSTMALMAEGFIKLLARVDTGFMRASVFVISRRSNGQFGLSTKSRARAEARALAKRAFSDSPLTASAESIVAVGAEYGEFVEEKHPWFEPGVKAAQDRGDQVLQQLINQAGG
jgi:hypothetical protein